MRIFTRVCTILVSASLTPGLAQEKVPMRVEPPAPFGAGGALVVSVDPALCQSELVLRVMREDRDAPWTRWNVFDTPAVKPCSWTIDGLWPGNYEVALHRTSPRQVVAWRGFVIEAGRTAVEVLHPSRTEVAGVFTINGSPGSDLAGVPLHFTSHHNPAVGLETLIDDRGEYRASLDFTGDGTMWIGGSLGLIANTRQLKIEDGRNHFDVDLPEGLIKVTIVPPPGLSPEFRIMVVVEHEALPLRPGVRPAHSRRSKQVRMDATRTHVVIGQGFGLYKIQAMSDTGDPSDSVALAGITVNVTPDEPRHEVTLKVPKVPAPLPSPNLNIEGCPPPRTVACVHGLPDRR
jgi:hypothetical protein